MADNSRKSQSNCSDHLTLPIFVITILIFVMFIVGLGIGTAIGYFAVKPECQDSNLHQRPDLTAAIANKTFLDAVLGEVNAENIRENLRVFASQPHIAGLSRDKELADFIRQRWLRDGLDSAELVPYDVLLSYPNPSKPNKIEMLNSKGTVVFESSVSEDSSSAEDPNRSATQAFNAYAPNGTVDGKLVYANYGTVEDFDMLASQGVNVTNTIVLIRNGVIFRGNKVENAHSRGAVGVVLFTDASRVSPEGVDPLDVYPNTVMLPPSGVQWGAVYPDIGDPLTPYWPSVEGAFRLKESEAMLPKIPSQPISYQDAEKLLVSLGGQSAPAEWRGYGNLPHYIGPSSSGMKIRLQVHNQLARVTVYNVIGKLTGSVEPDRYVIEGNHRDAWGVGASDPSSGTAQLLETVRVFGLLKQRGWRPRRTLIFGSWAAEEFGVIGSQEWVEENANLLMNRAVGYVNTDVCVSGPDLEVSASPLLAKMVFRATKLVQSPSRPTSTVYERWRATFPVDATEEDMIEAIGSGTDVAPFAFFAGVPVADIWFRIDQKKHNVTMYPAYHTEHDSLHMMETLVDPDFMIHRACSQLALVMLLDLADSPLVPLEPVDLANAILKALNFLDENLITSELETVNNITLKYLKRSIHNFTIAVDDWYKRLSNIKLTDMLQLRSLNDQLLQVERSLILPGGLPGRPNSRHVVFSPSTVDAYSSSAFSGITDLVPALSRLTTTEAERRQIGADIERHITEVMVQIDHATAALRPV